MEDYNFWADLLASYRASPDLIKALWLLVPLAPMLGLVALAVTLALRLMEPARRASHDVVVEQIAHEEAGGHPALIDMEPVEFPVSRRLPSR